MKEEELIKKLESVQLPDIKLPCHRSRLKMALLEAAYLKHRDKAVQETAGPERKGVIGKMVKNFLVSPQPVWKTALVSVLAIAIILGFSLTMPFTPESLYAQAEEIVQNSPEVHAALGEETEIKLINISDGTVIAQSGAGTISAKVNLKTDQVTDLVFCAIDDQMVIAIAESDPMVKELLDSGATIGDVSTMYISGQNGNVLTGETVVISETLVTVDINGSDGSYLAYIDLAGQKVAKLVKTEAMDSPPGSPEVFTVPDPAFGESQ